MVTLIATRSVLLLPPQLSIIFSVIVIVRLCQCLRSFFLSFWQNTHTQNITSRNHRPRHEWRETESFVSAKCVYYIHHAYTWHATRIIVVVVVTLLIISCSRSLASADLCRICERFSS